MCRDIGTSPPPAVGGGVLPNGPWPSDVGAFPNAVTGVRTA